jgi:putative transposase
MVQYIGNTLKGQAAGKNSWPHALERDRTDGPKDGVLLKEPQRRQFPGTLSRIGISAKTGYKWRERFLERGYQGLEELSRRPHSHPEQLEVEQVCAIVRLKQARPFWGARKIAELYRRRYEQAVSESTIKRILERSGLVDKRKVGAASQSRRLSSGRKAQGVNQVWTVDFKGWGWRKDQRCQPLGVRDEYSRYILGLESLKDGSSDTVRKSFESLFARYGLPQAIRSDNGSPFASSQSVWV